MPKKITIEAYTFDELDDDAKERAREWYRSVDDFPELSENMDEYLEEELEERHIKVVGDKPKLWYSLGHVQRDGVSFEGTFQHDGYQFKVTRSGQGVHMYTMDFELQGHVDEDGLGDDGPGESRDDEDIVGAFRDLCHEVCDRLQEMGYEDISAEDSDETVDERLTVNEYLFTKEGRRCALFK